MTTQHLIWDIDIVMETCITEPDDTIGKAVYTTGSLPLGCVSISVIGFRFAPRQLFKNMRRHVSSIITIWVATSNG